MDNECTANFLEGDRQVKPKFHMAKAANDYYEAHGHPTDNHDRRDKKTKGTRKTV